MSEQKWHTVFLTGTPAEIEAPLQDGWRTVPVRARKAKVLAEGLEQLCQEVRPTAVIVHVSGYGYQDRGVPLWLLKGLRRWRQGRSHVRLIGIFHELFATGKLWNSSFWLARAQRHVTQGLWFLCDFGLTNTDTYFDELVTWRPEMRKRLELMPIFSNVGEPGNVVPFSERPPHVAVFGRKGVDRFMYHTQQFETAAAINALGIWKVIDIGVRTNAPPSHLGQAAIIPFGQLSRDFVSRQLLTCRFGLLSYDIARLAKSTVFAAYAAHGVVPICVGSKAKPRDGLEEGKHFLCWPFHGAAIPNFRDMQINLKNWYQAHSTLRQAKLMSLWCSGDVQPAS
jgi:hypothetical protein